MRRVALAALAALGLGAAGPAPAAEPPGVPAARFSDEVLARDFRLFLTWFEGEFDNAEQALFASELGYPKDAVPSRIHSIFAPVVAPAVGEHVFYVQQYSDNDPAKIYRQRIYVFSLDKAAKAIRLDIFTPKAPAALKDAHLTPGKLAGLTRADLEATPGCEVYWRRQANQFVGWMPPGACKVKSRASGKTLSIVDNLLLTENEIWIADEAFDETGQRVFGNVAGIPHKLKRARAWTCWMAVPREGKPDSWFYAGDLKLTDQGGEVWAKTDDATPREIGYRLRQVDWPAGTNQNALTLYVMRKGEPRAVGYSWASPDATRIGINLRWMQGSCSR